MAQLVEALRYKPDSRVRFPMISLDFFNDIILRQPCVSGVDSAPDRNKYHEYLPGVKAVVRKADNLTIFMCRLS